MERYIRAKWEKKAFMEREEREKESVSELVCLLKYLIANLIHTHFSLTQNSFTLLLLFAGFSLNHKHRVNYKLVLHPSARHLFPSSTKVRTMVQHYSASAIWASMIRSAIVKY